MTKNPGKYRIHPQALFNFDELVVDNFAGGGGASTGIEAALGRPVDIAVNHDRIAVAMHTVNHPHTRHYCESVWDVDPVDVCSGRPVGFAWFSPDCRHFSKAKGGKPVEKNIRGLAWVVLKWAAKVKPRIIVLENVEEFRTWGPLKGKRPCPARKGQTFKKWCSHLEALGYRVEHRELRACDYGAPTIRKRLFVIARRDGKPIAWPAPTHADPKSPEVKNGQLKPWRTAAECIDWSVPCPSIFERKRPLADATMRRIAKGVMRYVVNSPEPFIIQTGYGERAGQSPRVLDKNKPLGTVVAGAIKHAVVAPVLTEHANASSPRCMPTGEPLRTICSSTKGGHHAMVTAFLAKHYGGVVGTGVNGPMHTVTATDHHALVTSSLVKLRGTCRDGQPVTEPMPTVTAGGNHIGEVRAFLMKYYGTDQDPNLRDPLHTVTSRDRFGLVTVRGEHYSIVDIGMRMLTPRELYRAQGFPENYIIDRDADGHPITKTEQVAKCGNSVCPPIAKAIVQANMAVAERVVAEAASV